MMEDDLVKVPVAEIRPALLELCAYIPYFEERVGGTFKFQYWDEETDELKDMEGYEEHNRDAMFPDPNWDDTWYAFRNILIRRIRDKFGNCTMLKYFGKTKIDDWDLPEDKLGWPVFNLTVDAIHERMFTGYTEICMERGIYLRHLKNIASVLEELPEDAVITCPRRKPPRHARQVAGSLTSKGGIK